MPKPSPNDPCPCASGRKYKRCCGDPSKARPVRQAEAAAAAFGEPPDETAASQEEPFEWPLLDTSRIPRRVLTAAEFEALFKPPHRRLFDKVRALSQDGNQASDRRALELLSQVPEAQRDALWGMPELLIILLDRLDEKEPAWNELLRALPARGDETSWFEHGGIIAARIADCNDPHLLTRTIDGMRRAIACCSNVVPRFVLGLLLLLTQNDDVVDSEALDLLYKTFLDPVWEKHRVHFKTWRTAASYGLSATVEGLVMRGRKQEALVLARRVATFPWVGEPSGASVVRVLDAMNRARALDEAVRLGRAAVAINSDLPSVHFWIGTAECDRGDKVRGMRHLRRALRAPEVVGRAAEWVASVFLGQREWKLALEATALVGNQRTEYGHYVESVARLELHEPQLACEAATKLWEMAPSRAESFALRLQALTLAGRAEEMEPWLREVLDSHRTTFHLGARFALAKLLLDSDRSKEALELIAAWINGPLPAKEPIALAEAHGVVADILAANLRHAEAVGHFERAARVDPSPSRCSRFAQGLLAAGRNEQAETEASISLQLWPDSVPLLMVGALSADALGSWAAVLDRVAALGDPWTLENDLRDAIVAAKLRALCALERPLDALLSFEGHLETALTDPELRRLRDTVVAETAKHFSHLTRTVERDQRRLRAQHEETRRVVAELRRGAERKQEEIHRLLRKREASSAAPATRQIPTWEVPRLPQSMATPQVALIESAERAWESLAARPQDDHGAVVIQLARVVESVINQQAVDPLAALCLARHKTLAPLETVTSGLLRPSNNRLSLGEAAAMIWAERELREADGSVTLVRNPRSTEQHQRLVEEGWTSLLGAAAAEEDREYFRNKLAGELSELTRLRNQAGHAGAPLPRDAAARARNLVLGDSGREGLLPRVVRCLGDGRVR